MYFPKYKEYKYLVQRFPETNNGREESEIDSLSKMSMCILFSFS